MPYGALQEISICPNGYFSLKSQPKISIWTEPTAIRQLQHPIVRALLNKFKKLLTGFGNMGRHAAPKR